MDLRTWMEDRVRRNRDRAFLFFEGQQYTYGEFDQNVSRVANALAGLGITRGDKVGIMLPNTPHHLYTWLGAMKLGAIDVPINPQFKGKLLSDMVRLCELDAIVIDHDIYDGVRDDVACVEKKIVDSAKGPPVTEPQVLCFSTLVGAATADDPPVVELTGSDIASFIFTSGTTGLPKAAMLPHAYYIHHAEKWARTMQTSRDDRFFCPLPLYHVVRVTGFVTALASEASFVLGRRFSAGSFWDQAREDRFTVFAGHFAIYEMLLSMPARPDDRDNPLQKVSGILARSVDGIRERFGVEKCYNTFGMTEAGFPCIMEFEQGASEDICGPPGSDFRVKIFDDGDDELPEGEVGEIVVRPERPDIMFKGYYKQEDKTLEVFDNLWFHTGDLGYMKQGNLVFTERRSESIRRKGEFVPISPTEEVLRAHPGVKDAAICGVRSELDEEVKACLVLKQGEEPGPEEIIAYCEENLPRFAVPRYLEFLEELPRTPGTEKVQRYKLRERGTGEAWDREQSRLRNPGS